jgi:hypothetical protein
VPIQHALHVTGLVVAVSGNDRLDLQTIRRTRITGQFPFEPVTLRPTLSIGGKRLPEQAQAGCQTVHVLPPRDEFEASLHSGAALAINARPAPCVGLSLTTSSQPTISIKTVVATRRSDPSESIMLRHRTRPWDLPAMSPW